MYSVWYYNNEALDHTKINYESLEDNLQITINNKQCVRFKQIAISYFWAENRELPTYNDCIIHHKSIVY